MKRNNNEAKNVAKANTNMADHLTPFDTELARGGSQSRGGGAAADYVCACGAQIKASITQTCTHTE